MNNLFTCASRANSRNLLNSFSNLARSYFTSRINSSYNLAEIGKFCDVKLTDKYATGQLFLHKVFGYRGVVLFAWKARVFDRDVLVKGENKPDEPKDTNFQDDPHFNNPSKESKGKTSTYYQVLIDNRDCPFIRAQTEGITFLGSQENARSLYAVPGLDYVSHEDVMPYSTLNTRPIFHELFEKFLTYSANRDPPFVGKESLKSWEERNSCWLELSDVQKETTENIRVTAIPFYMGCRTSHGNSFYWWRYCVRLENLGKPKVTLRERHWRIFSLSGLLETIRGRGVVGQEPILSPNNPAFQYSSHVSLPAPSGHMWGTFKMEREDGYCFDCRIPPFSLESKQEDNKPFFNET